MIEEFLKNYDFVILYIIIPFLSAVIGGVVSLAGKIYFENWQARKRQDRMLYKKIIDALPEQNTQNFINDVWNAFYHKEFLSNLDNYKNVKNLPNAVFFIGKIEKTKKKLNESFAKLFPFLIQNFFSDQNLYVLYKELQESNPEEYKRKFEELRGLVDNFDLAYKNFLKVSKEKHIA